MAGSWRVALTSVLDDWDGDRLVISPDVDGLLSAALVCQLRGARVVGIYTTTHLLLGDGATRSDAREALWLDHDISHPGVRCIGQHLVLHSPGDTLPLRHPVSFNPNHYFGQTYQESFRGFKGSTRDKYPFGTIHLLMEGLGVSAPEPASPAASLLAHADGTWAATLDYATNCALWERLMFSSGSVIAPLGTAYISSQQHLAIHGAIVQDLVARGVSARRARQGASPHVPKDWHHIQGHQGIPFRINADPVGWIGKLRAVADYVAVNMGWSIRLPDRITDVVTGTVHQPYPDSIKRGEFDAFMLGEKIFSHAIKARNMLRYTTGISLP